MYINYTIKRNQKQALITLLFFSLNAIMFILRKGIKMEYKNIFEAKKALSDKEEFYLDNQVYQGFEEKGKTYLIIDNQPTETHNKYGYIRKDRGQAFFEPQNQNLAVDIDAKEGFLYQQSSINRLSVLSPEEDFRIEGHLDAFKAGSYYLINNKGEISKISENKLNSLTKYDYMTFDKTDVEQDREILLNLARQKNEKQSNEYSTLLKNKSSIMSISLPKRPRP